MSFTKLSPRVVDGVLKVPFIPKTLIERIWRRKKIIAKVFCTFYLKMQQDGGREEKFRLYNDALVHFATCSNLSCTFSEGRCLKIRKSVEHFAKCYGQRRLYDDKSIDNCDVCSKIWGLLCFHAKYCATALADHCATPQCDYLRQKIAYKQRTEALDLNNAREQLAAAAADQQHRSQEWPTELRIAAAERARLETMAMIEEIRRQKSQFH